MIKYLFFDILFQEVELYSKGWHINEKEYPELMLNLAAAIVDPTKAPLLVNHPAERVIASLLGAQDA